MRRQPGDCDLVEADRSRDVLEPVLAEIDQAVSELLLLVLEQALCRLRDEDLTAVAGGTDAAGAVDRESGVASFYGVARALWMPILTLTAICSGHLWLLRAC